MRRHGLRQRLDRQRRLTRLLTARHALTRRAPSMTRLLEAIGAWFVEESLAPLRFVPPLLGDDVVSADAMIQDWRDAAVPADVLESDVDGEDVDAISGPRALGPNRQAERTPAPAAFTRSVPPLVDRPTARPAAPNVGASDTRRPTTRQAIQPSRDTQVESTAQPRSPDAGATRASSPPGVDLATPATPIERRPDETLPVNDIGRAETRLAPEASRARPSLSEGRTPDGADRDANEALVRHEGIESDPGAPSVAPVLPGTPTDASPSKTAYEAVVERALAALRSSGELPHTSSAPADRTAAGTNRPIETGPSARAKAATEPGARAATGAGREQRTTPSAPPLQHRPVPAPGAAAAPNVTAAPVDRSAPDVDVRQADREMPRGGYEDALPQVAEATSLHSPDASPRMGAESEGSDRQTSGAGESEPPADRNAAHDAPRADGDATPREHAQPVARVDEVRQARRPPNLERTPGRPPVSPPDLPPPAASVRPPETGPFRFTETERTPREWQRLLFEATSPPARRSRRDGPSLTADSPGRSRDLGVDSPASPASASRRTAVAPPVGGRRHAQTERQVETIANPNQMAPRGGVPRSEADVASQPIVNRAPLQHELEALGDRSTESVTLPRHSVTEDVVAQPSPEVAGPDASDAASPRPHATPDVRASSSSSSASVARAVHAMPTDPIAPSARRFLAPLVGIDPDSVRVHRGDRADRVADRFAADGLAIGDDIVIPSGHDDRTPDGLALLAHELTHVARSRDRRFVPPISRGHHGQTVSGWAAAVTSRSPVAHEVPTANGDDEEHLANHVETEVRRVVAYEQARASSAMPDMEDEIDSGDSVDTSDGTTTSPATNPIRAAPSEPVARGDASSRSRWGGLPAPWEPLPPSLIAPRQPSSITRPDADALGTSASFAAAGHGTESTSAVQLAARDRPAASEEPAHAEAPPETDPGATNLDALARQVYDVLKRRLAAERRRGA